MRAKPDGAQHGSAVRALRIISERYVRMPAQSPLRGWGCSTTPSARVLARADRLRPLSAPKLPTRQRSTAAARHAACVAGDSRRPSETAQSEAARSSSDAQLSKQRVGRSECASSTAKSQRAIHAISALRLCRLACTSALPLPTAVRCPFSSGIRCWSQRLCQDRML